MICSRCGHPFCVGFCLPPVDDWEAVAAGGGVYQSYQVVTHPTTACAPQPLTTWQRFNVI